MEEKVQETDDVVIFVITRIDDRLVKTSLPGQYVTVKVPIPDGRVRPRQYSLTQERERVRGARQHPTSVHHPGSVLVGRSSVAGRPVITMRG